jgi:hypothetical protein
MYKLTIKKNGKSQVMGFETIELANLYRDYHLTFGEWASLVKWVEESTISAEDKPYIVDEKMVKVSDKLVRFFKVVSGISFELKDPPSESIKDVWRVFRESRTKELFKTDWSQVPDSALTMEAKKDFRGYRSYLRALPSLHNDETIVSAKIYSFADWKKGCR